MSTQNALHSLQPLINEKSLIKDADEFNRLVNVIFHDHEAAQYDEVHSEMWKSLPQQYDLIANDIVKLIKPKQQFSLLDVGCGTGLATQMLLDTILGPDITEIHLLDTSGKMLKKAGERSKKWNKKIRITEGDITQLHEKYDVIIISSVLHHIPDISRFLLHLKQLQKIGGILITMHDPAAEAIESELYKKRCEEYNSFKEKQVYIKPTIFKRAFTKIINLLKPQDYIEKINNDLLRKKIIKKPLTAPELWSITDIHVESLPYSASNGISKSSLINGLSEYDLVSYNTYAFFGILKSNLDTLFEQKEQELFLNKDLFGRNFSSAWIKK
ncbi:MAG TPA: class I SAM-dependent methyltransferase [Mucilaginibacter sp.]|jgi:ubiquinone/menaquinone biosynthesis C-methylase UbiE|nr:class I SAM-dependent methyltransferase [Mucilaginibacter sp.]